VNLAFQNKRQISISKHDKSMVQKHNKITKHLKEKLSK